MEPPRGGPHGAPTVDPSQAASGPERFNAIYASPESPTRLAIFREVYEQDYPEKVAPAALSRCRCSTA
jgi:hypothetical protein